MKETNRTCLTLNIEERFSKVQVIFLSFRYHFAITSLSFPYHFLRLASLFLFCETQLYKCTIGMALPGQMACAGVALVLRWCIV